MKLCELLSQYSDDEIVAVGAKTGFIYIAPKAEFVTCEGYEAIKDREVVSKFYDDSVHKGHVIKIKGDDYGAYWMRSEITNQPEEFHLEEFDTDGAHQMIAEVIALFVYDVAILDLIERTMDALGMERYDMSTNIERKYELAKRNVEIAEDFFKSGWCYKYSPIPGDRLLSYGHEAVNLLEQKMIKEKAMSHKGDALANIKKLYSRDDVKRIQDMILDGETPLQILKQVGAGKEGKGTRKDIEKLQGMYQRQLEAERRRFFRNLNIEPTVPLRRHMTYKGREL